MKTSFAKFTAFATSAIAIAAFATGCATTKTAVDKAESTPAPETKVAAAEVHASHVTEVNFTKNSFVLTEGARQALTDMINTAKANGSIDDVKVIAYADKDYPSNATKQLSKKERDLANKRADAVSNYLKSQLAVTSVNKYSMAERPNAFQKTFNTSDAKIKSALETAGVTSATGETMTGKSSRAIIMVMMK